MLKGHWTTSASSPIFFQKVEIFISLGSVHKYFGGGAGQSGGGGQKSFELPEGGTKKFSVVKGGVKKV